jgi:ubiquinone/menaquinone biosynthesis C-methylase UbiE
MLLADNTDAMQQQSASHFDFDKVADSYDRWYDSARGAMYDRLEKQAFGGLLPDITKGNRLLEVGCGTGHWSRYFSDKGFEVTGIDVSIEMIKIAKARNIANSHFQVADGESLPFADNSFDVAAAIATLEFVRDAEVVVREMVRCTYKLGGRLLIGVLNELARLNRNRKQRPESLYAKARLFSPRELKQLLVRYGEACVVTAGFTPRQKHLLPLSPLIDTVGRLLHIPYGAFIAAEVRL